ncbi:hypothetical protein NQZ68_001792 [Dissostichus eleginoides]|nr:hypothetical protein NQZ68_001792 [Dissostichus eleginoides]
MRWAQTAASDWLLASFLKLSVAALQASERRSRLFLHRDEKRRAGWDGTGSARGELLFLGSPDINDGRGAPCFVTKEKKITRVEIWRYTQSLWKATACPACQGAANGLAA